jgi:hypothetical protein
MARETTRMPVNAPELDSQADSLVDEEIVVSKLGHTRASFGFRLIDRIGAALRLTQSDDSLVSDFERELAKTKSSRFQLKREIEEVIFKLEKAKGKLSPFARRSIYRSLGDKPIQVVFACRDFRDWNSLNNLRRPLRSFWEHRGSWIKAASFAVESYIKAAELVHTPSELPWIRAIDAAWFAALSDQRDLAHDNANRALIEFRRTQELRGEAFCRRVLGLLALHNPDNTVAKRAELAIVEFDLGSKIAEGTNQVRLAGRLHAHKAAAYILAGEYKLAETQLDHAISSARHRSDSHLLAVCLIKSAEIALAQKKNTPAKLLLHDAIFAAADIAAYEFGKACFLMAECLRNEAAPLERLSAEAVTAVHQATNYCRWAREAFDSIEHQAWATKALQSEAALVEQMPKATELTPELEEILEKSPFWLWDNPEGAL